MQIKLLHVEGLLLLLLLPVIVVSASPSRCPANANRPRLRIHSKLAPRGRQHEAMSADRQEREEEMEALSAIFGEDFSKVSQQREMLCGKSRRRR